MSVLVRQVAPIVALLLSAVAYAAGGEAPAVVPYAQKAHFRQDAALHFKDFDLTFLGRRRKSWPVYPRGFVYYDFRVISGKESQVVSWTSGTGDIGAERFKVSGRDFDLELGFSDALGRLQDDELVVTQVKSSA